MPSPAACWLRAALLGLAASAAQQCACAGDTALCSGRGLADFRPSMVCDNKIHGLDLSRNALQQFPDLSGLLDVTRLDVSHNSIQSILPDALVGTQLSDLNVSWNALDGNASQPLKGLAGLRQLEVSHNQLQELAFLPEPCALTQLDASGNRVEELGPLLRCRQLVQLRLSSNRLRKLPTAALPAGLQELDLSYNHLESVGQELGELADLRRLNLSLNKLVELTAVALSQHLEHLDVSGNQLRTLPAELGQLSRLRELFLWGNQLTELPGSALPQHLEKLWVSDNLLESLPPELGRLQRLTHLYASDNQLQELPGQALPSSLEQLAVSRNHISELPPELGHLPRLRLLAMWGNQLRELPGPALPPQLEQLDVSLNHLSELPPELGRLPRLRALFAGYNQLRQLPAPGPWPALRRLWLPGNGIRAPSAARLRPLLGPGRALDLRWNPLQPGPWLLAPALAGWRPDADDRCCGSFSLGAAAVRLCLSADCDGQADWVSAAGAALPAGSDSPAESRLAAGSPDPPARRGDSWIPCAAVSVGVALVLAVGALLYARRRRLAGRFDLPATPAAAAARPGTAVWRSPGGGSGWGSEPPSSQGRAAPEGAASVIDSRIRPRA